MLQTDADAHKKKQESLSPEDKDLFVKSNTAAQKKHRKSLAPDQKANVLKTDAAKHKKHKKSLSPEQKGQIKSMNAGKKFLQPTCSECIHSSVILFLCNSVSL